MVSLKAPINDGEVSSIYVRYKPNGEVIYNLPVLVSGSTPLDKDLDVRIAVDPDTLNAMNEANFHELRKDLWYNLLPQENYEFPSTTCQIFRQVQERNYSLSSLSFRNEPFERVGVAIDN